MTDITPQSSASGWHSAWKPAFDDLVAAGPTPQEAVARILKFGLQQGFSTPRYYVSTAITSAGWRRDPRFRDPSNIGEAVEHNNRTASRILDQLAAGPQLFIDGSTMMVPTDLGKVPRWTDTDYLIFYFAWLAGLNAAGASTFAASFNDPVYTGILHQANDRSVSDNEKRWPAYQVFTEIAIAKLRLVESLPHTRSGDGAQVLIQLVDVEQSLGCRAEKLFADARDLDIIIPTFSDRLSGPLGEDVRHLREIGAAVGGPRSDVELTPVRLR